MKTNPLRKKLMLVVGSSVIALAAAVVFTTAGLARTGLTPNSGVLVSNVVARAGFADPTDLKFKVGGQGKEVMNVPNARETVMQQVVIAPGGYTGWHTHPGPVLVLVKAGALTLYSSEDPTCTGRTYTVGQSFIDPGQGHVHIGRNEGSENLEIWSAYFDVPPGAPFRIDAPSPGNCAF
jgi:quercetin dioxygenase-like cupin family protein